MKLRQKHGLFNVVIMGLGGALGFEIFVLMDYAYFQLAGPRIVLALLFGGLINLLIMLSYCELCATLPEVGGEYTYTKAAYGGPVAFMSGSLRWLASVFGAALAALTFAYQLSFLFSTFSNEIQRTISAHTPIIAISMITLLAALDIRGVKRVGIIIVAALLATFTILGAAGVWHGFTPPQVIPENLAEGLPGVLAATAYMFPMFFGVRAIVAGASSVENPEKCIPRGILLSSLLIIPFYLIVAYVAVGIVQLGEASSPLLNFVAVEIMGPIGGVLFSIAGMAAALSSLSTSITVQSSIARGMSRDGYLPKILLSIHRRFGSPYVAIIAGSIFIIFFTLMGTLEFLGYAASFGSLLVFAFVNLSLMKLRTKKPRMKKPFARARVLYTFTPIAGFFMSLVLLFVPMLLGDVSAVNALISGLGLMALVFVSYYIRMVGTLRGHRLQIALGGGSLGVGIFGVLLSYLIRLKVLSLSIIGDNIFLLMGISVVSILAGILNISAHIRPHKVF